ncbi:MAG: DegV family protein [Bacilli bacterium]|nr:DegV family protein [Bacilli bacterium]
MRNYEIVIDSSADLNAELRARFGIYEDYIRGIIYMPGDKEQLADLEWKNQSSEEYFKIVKAKPGVVHTAFATTEEFNRVVEPILKEGKDVIVFTMSSGMSGTANAFRLNAEMLCDDYPDRKVAVIDTLKYSSAVGMLAVRAAELRDAGKSFDEVVADANEVKFNLHEAGAMDDLRFLAASGRLSAGKAFFGQMVGVQPFSDFTVDGKNVPLGTLKGAKLIDECSLVYLEKIGEDLSNQIIFITHSARKERAEQYKKAVIERFNPKEVIVTEVGESCGANIGPGLCCFFFYGKKMEADRALETAVFTEYKGK